MIPFRRKIFPSARLALDALLIATDNKIDRNLERYFVKWHRERHVFVTHAPSVALMSYYVHIASFIEGDVCKGEAAIVNKIASYFKEYAQENERLFSWYAFEDLAGFWKKLRALKITVPLSSSSDYTIPDWSYAPSTPLCTYSAGRPYGYYRLYDSTAFVGSKAYLSLSEQYEKDDRAHVRMFIEKHQKLYAGVDTVYMLDTILDFFKLPVIRNVVCTNEQIMRFCDFLIGHERMHRYLDEHRDELYNTVIPRFFPRFMKGNQLTVRKMPASAIGIRNVFEECLADRAGLVYMVKQMHKRSKVPFGTRTWCATNPSCSVL